MLETSSRRNKFSVLVQTKINEYLPLYDRKSFVDAIDLHYSEIHQAPISTFNYKNLDPQDRSFVREVFSDHLQAVHKTADGKDMWNNDEQSEHVNSLKTFMKNNYLICPSQGQFIEGGVKDAGITGATGAEEKRRNELSIIRSHSLGVTNKLAQLLQVHKDGDKKDHAPQGSNFTSSFLNEFERQTRIELTGEEINEAKRLMAKEYQYKKTRQDRWLTKVMSARKKNRSNVQRGVDYTPGLRELVSYGPLQKNTYLPQI